MPTGRVTPPAAGRIPRCVAPVLVLVLLGAGCSSDRSAAPTRRAFAAQAREHWGLTIAQARCTSDAVYQAYDDATVGDISAAIDRDLPLTTWPRVTQALVGCTFGAEGT